jgi:glucan phosphoethanolaminetransferase (alkaline phosphatase superfamily)
MILAAHKIDAILSEGFDLRKFYTLNNVLKHPMLTYALSLYSFSLFIFGKARRDLKKITKENKVHLYYVDANPNDFLKKYYKWYFPPITLLIFFVAYWKFWLSPTDVVINKIVALIMPAFVYMLLVAVSTAHYRNKKFFENTQKIMKSKKLNSVVFICGHAHVPEVKRLLSNGSFISIVS